MNTDDWIGLSDIPSLADYRALNEIERNGDGTHTPENSWTPRNLAELPEQPPVQPTLGGVGIVYPGKRHVFSGPQESAKTLAAYAIGLEVIRVGERFCLIDFEMGPWDARTRLRELGATDDEFSNVLYVEPDVGATADATDYLIALQPALVIVDAAAGAFALQQLDDNARKDVEQFANLWVTPFWKAGIATIMLDHVVKNAEARGKYAIGSERKVGGADVHLGFEVVSPVSRGSNGLYKIVTHKDRGGFLKRGKLADFTLTSDPETHTLTWAFKAPAEIDDEHPFRPTVLMERVSRYLERQMEPVPMKQLEEDVEGKREGIRTAVTTLRDEGWIDEQEGPRKARLLSSIRPYREEYETDLPPRPSPRPDLAPESASATSPLAPSAYRRGEDEGDVPTSPHHLAPPLDDRIPF